MGKGEYQAVVLDPTGKNLYGEELLNEAWMNAVFSMLAAHSKVLFVVDLPAILEHCIAPHPVPEAADVTVGYLTGLAVRRVAGLHP